MPPLNMFIVPFMKLIITYTNELDKDKIIKLLTNIDRLQITSLQITAFLLKYTCRLWYKNIPPAWVIKTLKILDIVCFAVHGNADHPITARLNTILSLLRKKPFVSHSLSLLDTRLMVIDYAPVSYLQGCKRPNILLFYF